MFGPAGTNRPSGATGCVKSHAIKNVVLNERGMLGWEGFEPSTSRLKAGCSTTELPTLLSFSPLLYYCAHGSYREVQLYTIQIYLLEINWLLRVL